MRPRRHDWDSLLTPDPPAPLIASAGGPYGTVYPDHVLELDGAGSSGEEKMSYRWTVLPDGEAPPPLLADASMAKARFAASGPGRYKATLLVSGGGREDSDTTEIIVVDLPASPKPVSDDADWWRDQFQDSRRQALSNIQQAAQKWQALLATILSLLATVAFVSAPTALDKVPADRASAAVVLVAFAFFCALASLLYASAASYGTPRRQGEMDFRIYREAALNAFDQASKYLRKARLLTLLAIGTIVVGTLVIWSGAILKSRTTAGTSAIVRADGVLYCGTLSSSEQGNQQLLLGGNPMPGKVEDSSVVDFCPLAPSSDTWLMVNAESIRGAGLTIGLIVCGTFLWGGGNLIGISTPS